MLARGEGRVTVRPSAQGSLAKTPFAHLLLYLQSRKLSGTLAVWTAHNDGGQDRILFEAGQLTAMRPLAPAATLYAALLPLFARESAPYGFYEGHNLLGQRGALLQGPIDLHTLLAQGVRTHANEAVMDTVLERIRGRDLRLRHPAALERLELNPRELALIEPLRTSAATLDALIGRSQLGPYEAKRTLYLLALVRAIEAVGQSSIPAAPMDSFPPQTTSVEPASAYTLTGALPPSEQVQAARERIREATRESTARRSVPAPAPADNDTQQTATPSAPPAPLGLSDQDAARWNELSALYARLDELTHYELLNVAKSASSQDVQSAYYALVKRVHPDRLPLALAPLVRVAQVVFDRATEASTVLSDAKTRASYDEAVAGGGGTRAAERTMRNVLESALEYQKAEVLSRRREYAQAMQLVRGALAKNADDADCHALFAWLLHLTNPSMPAPLDEMLRSLDRALKINPRHERAHYVKGVVLKRLKRDAEAMRHFRTAAEINPHNVDAAREVRLANMRRESNKPPPNNPGVLSRLFKK